MDNTQSSELQRAQNESVYSLTAFEHYQRVAKMLAASELVPKEFRSIQNAMIALEMANRTGASPLMVMQNLYIVHGKPGWSSTFIIAGINSCGRFNALRYEMGGTPGADDRSCIAWTAEKHVKIPEGIRTLADAYEANLPVLEGPQVTMKMAKAEGWIDKNGSKWKTMPDLMIRYRAAAFFGRLYAPEITMGMQSQEEIIDVSAVEVHNSLGQSTHDWVMLEELFDEKRAMLSDAELTSATRIIEGKEENSFTKLEQLLNSK